MREDSASSPSRLLRRAVIAIVATGVVATSVAYSKTPNNLIVVPPTDLPELARQTGEAMLLLHDTIDDRTLLYIEQNQGARLAIFDVTDPGHIQGEGAVQIDAPGPFDFVSTLGNRAEVVRFRQSQESAVLDLHKVKRPTLTSVQGPTLQGTTRALGEDGFVITSQADAVVRSTRDFRVVDTASLGELNQVFDVREIREDLTNPDTGTTFLLTQSGLYEIRRPVVEREHERRERDRMLMYAGGG